MELKLHEAIVIVLKEANRPLTCSEIADKINAQKLYERGDKNPLESTQISGRISKYSYLFHQDKHHYPMLISLGF